MENFEIIDIFFVVVLVVLGFIFYKYNSIKNSEIDDLTEENQNLKIQNSEQIVKLEEQTNRFNSFEKSQKDMFEELKNKKLYLENISETKSIEIGNLKEELSKYKTLLEEQNKAIKEKFELLASSEERLKLEFKNLASEIFADNSKKFSEQNQKDLGLILTPMKQQLTDFKKKVEDVYDKESKDRSALQQELKNLKELNLQMSNEANKLTKALVQDTKKQGSWGEVVLERVLESSGLRKDFEYRREVSLKDSKNKIFRPDAIIDLPDNRNIIIDAKTSLVAYNEYVSQEDESLKAVNLKKHISSIKEHIKNLSNKQYENLKGINSLDFIFMFIPIEGALLLALDNDTTLYDEAFKQKIILVSPTTLLVALKAVENSWRYEKQAQNIAEVYSRAEELYKKFYGFVDDLKRVGDSIKKADETYTDAFKKLSEGRGNLISQTTILKNISNIKPKKELDNILVEKATLSDVSG